MDNSDCKKILIKILEDISFSIEHLENISIDSFNEDEILNNAISFKFIQISEKTKKLPQEVILKYPNIPWIQISGLRNKIVHDYGMVNLNVIYDTVINDFPILFANLTKILNEIQRGC